MRKGELKEEQIEKDRLITKPDDFEVIDAEEISEYDRAEPVEDEYEYVELSQAVSDFAGRTADSWMPYVTIALVVIAAILFAIFLPLAKNVGGVGIIVAFSVLAFIFAIILAAAWRERKRTKAEYLHAESLRQEAMNMMEREEQGKESSDSGAKEEDEE